MYHTSEMMNMQLLNPRLQLEAVVVCFFALVRNISRNIEKSVSNFHDTGKVVENHKNISIYKY